MAQKIIIKNLSTKKIQISVSDFIQIFSSILMPFYSRRHPVSDRNNKFWATFQFDDTDNIFFEKKST